MGLVDFRRWLDVDARDGEGGAVALEIGTDGKLRLVVDIAPSSDDPMTVLGIALDYSDTGQLLDWLREAMGVMLAMQGNGVAIAAVAGAQLARDTPVTPEPVPASEPSGKV